VIGYPGEYYGKLPEFCERKGAVVVGILRKDKSILDLVEYDYFDDLKIIGKVVDRNLFKYSDLIENRYLSRMEYFEVIAGAQVLVVPYAEKYFGGAGPVMDAITAGTPILMNSKCYLSSWVVENEFGRLYDTGMLHKEFNKARIQFTESYCKKLYKKGQDNSWQKLSNSYKMLYERS
jgi:glycosyltransferase involved in cell wall biosynthesis